MTWQETLAEAGFPESVLVLDFETYFDSEYHMGKDKRALSTVEYIVDSRFEVLGLGARVVDGPGEFVPGPAVKKYLNGLTVKYGTALQNCTVVAQNAKFDCLILAEKYGLYPPYVVDTLDLLRYYDARMDHRLKAVAPMFKLGHKGDTGQFKGQHFSDIDLEAMTEYCLNGDVRIEEGLFKQLLPLVKNPKFELTLMRHTLDLYRKPKIVYDFGLAEQIRLNMTEQITLAVKDAAPWIMETAGFDPTDVEDALSLLAEFWLEVVKPWLSGDLSFVRLLQKALGAEPVPTKPGKPGKGMTALLGAGLIPALAKDDDGGKALLTHQNPIVRALATAHQAISSWPGHINRVNRMVAQAHASNGLLRNPLKYYGTHTGRWSGEEGINTANLGGSGRGKAISKLIGQVRNTMRAETGFTFVLCDSAQIEARNLAWFAGQQDLLAGFRTGSDIYSDFATDLFQVKVWKPNDEEKQTPEGKRAEIYRGFGKDAILGCGYGMGADKFYQRCLANDILRPLFDSGEYDLGFVGRLIKTYRTKYSLVPEFWGKVERAWRVAAKYGRDEAVGPLQFERTGGSTMNIVLPSGRCLRYRDAYVDCHDDLMYRYNKLWGGSLTENIMQATCRDYLAWWLLEVESRLHMPVVHHVYDELVVMVPAELASEYKKQIEAIMCENPPASEGMPFKAEGSISEFYKK